MKYSQAFEALQNRGLHINKVMQILNALVHFELDHLAQRIVLVRFAKMDIIEAGDFLQKHEYV